MSGCIGGMTGKAGEKTAGSEDVLKIAHDGFLKNITHDAGDNIDVFIFSWDTHLENEYKLLYKPKKIETQNQIVFEIPEDVKDNIIRFQSHYSRWYAVKRVVELKNSYEAENGPYDLVILTRLDLLWIKPFNLSRLNPTAVSFDQSIFLGQPFGSKKSSQLGDRFIASNSDYINKISTLYDHIDGYIKTIQMWKKISSHYMLPRHLEKFNIRDKVEFPFLYWDPSGNYNNSLEESHTILVRNMKKL